METENQLVEKYTGGLKEAIKDKLELKMFGLLSQEVNLALKVELQLIRVHKIGFNRRSGNELNSNWQ